MSANPETSEPTNPIENKEEDNEELTPDTTTDNTDNTPYSAREKQYKEAYQLRMDDAAKQTTYTIRLRIPTGNKIPDPFDESGKTLMDEYNGVEKKTYKRSPNVSVQDYYRMEKLRANFAMSPTADKVADNFARLYQYSAYIFLGMTKAEFDRIYDWQEIRLAIDACHHWLSFMIKSDSNTKSNPAIG